MELVTMKINPIATQLGGVYRVVGEYNGFALNCLAVCIKENDGCAEYITIKDYSAFNSKCYGDIFKLNLDNYKDFTTFTRVKPNELRVYPL